MEIYHALVHVCLCFHLVCGHTNTQAMCSAQLILDSDRRSLFWSEHAMRFSSQRIPRDPSEHRERIMETPYSTPTAQQHSVAWTMDVVYISDFSFSVGCSQILPCACDMHWGTQIFETSAGRSVRNDLVQWWMGKCREMGRATSINSIRNLCRLNTRMRRPKND